MSNRLCNNIQEEMIKILCDFNDGYNVCCDACGKYIGYGECAIFVVYDEVEYNLLCRKCWYEFFPNTLAKLADCTDYFLEKEEREEG